MIPASQRSPHAQNGFGKATMRVEKEARSAPYNKKKRPGVLGWIIDKWGHRKPVHELERERRG